MPSIITAGDASNGLVVASGNDGAVVIQSGLAGAKVDALSIAADGVLTGVGTGLTGTATGLVAGIGVGQTWQDVKASRALGTTYTNTTGRPIEVFLAVYATGAHGLTLTISGVVLLANATSTLAASLSAIIPPGGTYVAADGGSSPVIDKWAELR